MENILTELKSAKKKLEAELTRIDKAITALTPDAKPKAPRKPRENGLSSARILEACDDWTTAVKLAETLGTEDTTALAGKLSSLFGNEKLDRRGTRGSYEYRIRQESSAGTD